MKKGKIKAKKLFQGNLTSILACPKCKSKLKHEKAENFLICGKCKAKYPIKNGIAMLMQKKG